MLVWSRPRTSPLGYDYHVKEALKFSEDPLLKDASRKNAVGVFMGAVSTEFFQPYRLFNALVYLQRNGVSTHEVAH